MAIATSLAPLAATLPDFRMAVGLTRAERCKSPPFGKSKPSSLAAKQGLRYERKVGRELVLHRDRGNFVHLEQNPWFTFYDIYGTSNCSPDFLLWTTNGVVIVEVKLTWVEVAIHKLNDLYNPVVAAALKENTFPLVICRNITRDTPPVELTFRKALASPYRILLWPETGHIIW